MTYGWNLTVLVLNGQFRIIFFLAKSGSYRKPPMNILARVNIYLIFRQDGYPPPVGNLTKTRFDIPQYTLCMLQGTFIWGIRKDKKSLEYKMLKSGISKEVFRNKLQKLEDAIVEQMLTDPTDGLDAERAERVD